MGSVLAGAGGALGAGLVSNLFGGGSGASQATSQQNDQYGVGKDVKKHLWKWALPQAENSLKFMSSIDPMRQQMVSHILTMANPESYMGQAQNVGDMARSAAMNQARYAQGMYGADSGLAKGAFTHAVNAGTQAQTDFLRSLWDPSHQMAMANNALGSANAYGQGVLNNVGSVYDMIQNQRMSTPGPNPFDSFTSAVGPAFGSWASGQMFPGGHGGGNIDTSGLTNPASSSWGPGAGNLDTSWLGRITP